MLLTLTPDQEFFRETTSRFLIDRFPTSRLRQLRDDPAGFDAGDWRRGAELGWTSLLVSEEAGGGSVSGAGAVDLSLVAHEFGRHAAPGPLVDCNVAARARRSPPAASAPRPGRWRAAWASRSAATATSWWSRA
jgi:alkylation response protein AidB-like acyl-CoA dehydrogenase